MTCHCLHSVVLCSLEQRTKNILLLFLSKQNKTTKCKNKNLFLFLFLLALGAMTCHCLLSFCFFFVSPWGNDLSLSAFCCSLEQRTKNILLLFFSKQNKTTKCKNKKQVFVSPKTCCDNMSPGAVIFNEHWL